MLRGVLSQTLVKKKMVRKGNRFDKILVNQKTLNEGIRTVKDCGTVLLSGSTELIHRVK